MTHESVSSPRIASQHVPKVTVLPRKTHGTFWRGVCGMLAEVLFSLGLLAIGWIVSLVVGWCMPV